MAAIDYFTVKESNMKNLLKYLILSINVFVSGNKSLIKQSLFTNDTSILPHFDTRDPAFYKWLLRH